MHDVVRDAVELHRAGCIMFYFLFLGDRKKRIRKANVFLERERERERKGEFFFFLFFLFFGFRKKMGGRM